MFQMKIIVLFVVLLMFSTLNFAQNTNKLIGNTNNPEEPAICINSKNPAIIMAAANINNLYLSNDTGKTWNHVIMQSNYNVWGDPCIISDTAGDFYFFHLSNPVNGNWIDRIVCQKYKTSINTWVLDTFIGLNGQKAQDKEWAVVDPATNTIYITWTQFDEYDSHNPLDSSVILFSKSTDAGFSWSTPVRINKKAGDCIDSDSTVEGAVPAVGPNGEVYVAWVGEDGIMFDRSLDGGNTWLRHDIFVSSVPGGWDYSIPGISRCNGLPVLICDLSTGPNRGTLYINWSDQRNDTTDTDIWLVKSTNGGLSWSAPIRVNNDLSYRQQFLTWMTIDKSTGYLYFIFYDRRNHTDNQTDVFLAVSKDGGNTFENYKISESAFSPNENIFFGDYTNISVENGIIRPIWTRLHNNQLSVYTDLVDLVYLSDKPNQITQENIVSNVFPNPSSDEIGFSFKLKKEDVASLYIYDSNGKMVACVFENKNMPADMYIEKIKISKYNLSPGQYYFSLQTAGNQNRSRKFLIK